MDHSFWPKSGAEPLTGLYSIDSITPPPKIPIQLHEKEKKNLTKLERSNFRNVFLNFFSRKRSPVDRFWKGCFLLKICHFLSYAVRKVHKHAPGRGGFYSSRMWTRKASKARVFSLLASDAGQARQLAVGCVGWYIYIYIT